MGTTARRRFGADELVLKKSADFVEFIEQDFDFYAQHYARLTDASIHMVPGLGHIYYNARQGFTLQPMMLLAPLDPADSEDVARLKQRLVAIYVDIVLTRRIWNYRTISQSSMHDSMFRVMREIRRKNPYEVAKQLHRLLTSDDVTFASNDTLRVHQQNRYRLHQLLARIADYVEVQSGNPSRFLEYVAETGKNRYELEHIWADKPERHRNEFESAAEFREYRNRLGGLLLLPKSFNASYGSLPYEQKLRHYNTQGSLLARSLHPQAYDHNPGFNHFIARTGLKFHPHEIFERDDLAERQLLYRQIAERIWEPDQLMREVEPT